MAINDEREYRAALAELETLMGAVKGTPAAARQEELVAELNEYGRTHDIGGIWDTLNAGEQWSDMALLDLRDKVREGASVQDIAEFLCRDVEEVRQKIEELQRQDPPFKDVPDPPH